MNSKKKEEAVKAPAFSATIGNVRASVWANDNEGRAYYNVTLGRRYRDGEKWAFSNSLNGAGDVVHAIHALGQVLEAIAENDNHLGEEV
jgi:hypothetical protein